MSDVWEFKNKMSIRIAKGLFWGFASMLFWYAIAAALFPSKLLIEIGDAFAVPMSLAAFFVYCSELWNRPELEPLSGTDIVMLGIAGGWLTNAFDRGSRLWARVYDATIMDEPFIGLFLFMLVYFAALHVQVRGRSSRAGGGSMNGRRIIAIALACGAALSALVAYMELTK